MKPQRWVPVGIGATVLLLALPVALLPVGSPTSATADHGPAGIPARLADYSYFTGDVSASPAGRAVAIFQHGFGVEFLDFPQAVMVGADGESYRRLGVAEDRAGWETQGDPAPMLLSPDGAFVAVGDWDAQEPDLALLDLHTGKVQVYQVPGGHSAVPLAWSLDSNLVSYLSTAEPTNPYSGTAIRGDIGVLEPATGEARILPGAADVRAAAFSPDGTELAIHRIGPDNGSSGPEEGIPQIGGGAVEVVGLDGAVHQRLDLPPGQYLDGPNAWSPDGTLLATGKQLRGCQQLTGGWDEDQWLRCLEQTDVIFFMDTSGRGAPVPLPLKAGVVGGHGVLGWTGPGEVLVLDDVEGPDDTEVDSELYWLTALPLNGSEPRRLSAVPGGGNYGVGNFQLAAALLPDLQVQEPGQADRGRWPTMGRVAGAVALGGAALLAASFMLRHRRTGPLSR